jgi:DNA-binding PadR family transcriptional regulator
MIDDQGDTMYDTTTEPRPRLGRCRHHHHGPGGGPRRPGMRGRGGRARRGDVRAAVLALLVERPMHGYEIIQELEARTGGIWKPSPGSVYPTLSLLEDEALVTSETIDGRKRFAVTDRGREAAVEAGESPWDAVVRGADPTEVQLREGVMSVMVAARQIAAIGTDAQKAAAVELVTELRRKLYLLLAE